MSTIEKIKIFFGFKEAVDDDLSETSTQTIPAPSFQGSTEKMHSLAQKSALKIQKGKGSLSEIKIEEPRTYEDSLNIACDLRNHIPVIINLKHLDDDTSKRLIDFICGSAYAINGHMVKIATHIFLFTPQHILISHSEENPSFQEELAQEEKSIFFQNVPD